MRLTIPDINKEINDEEILSILEDNYSVLGPLWVKNQMEWTNEIYATFRDHDKFLIIIHLVKKTLDFYSRNFTKLTFEEFYSRDTVEIAKFNISSIAIELNIPKETARRKLAELEDEGALKNNNNRIIIDRGSYNFSKPINSIVRISRFLSTLSEICQQKKILDKRLTSESIEKTIKNNFSYIWKIYYELQIPMMLSYKSLFGNLEVFHIFGTCIVNEHLSRDIKKNNDVTNREIFVQNLINKSKKIDGLNAMSISDITGIPRATVIRKLKILLEKNFLIIDKKKHYKMAGSFVKILVQRQRIVFNNLARLSCQVYNLTIL